MPEANLIMPNMRGGCVRVGDKVHTLFRVTSSKRPAAPRDANPPAGDQATAQAEASTQ